MGLLVLDPKRPLFYDMVIIEIAVLFLNNVSTWQSSKLTSLYQLCFHFWKYYWHITIKSQLHSI